MQCQFLQANGHYVVVGLGASGLSAVHYLCALGYQVSVTDAALAPKLAAQLPAHVVRSFGNIDAALLMEAAGIVISPGVNPNYPAIIAAKARGIPVVSDVQLCIDYCHAHAIPIVAITGSNAKSTVTTLVGEIIKDAGLDVGVGGNLGTPAIELIQSPMAVCVLELSSFQLEHIYHLGAQAATILNLSPDHLDRHGDMQNYLAAKLAIFADVHQAVLFADDAKLYDACQDALATQGTQASIWRVGSRPPSTANAFGIVKDGGMSYLAQGERKLLAADELFIKGAHNMVNALFALALALAVGVPMGSILMTLKRFRGLPHRCEYVTDVAGRAYFNDSKGTNMGSTMAAITGLGTVYGQRSLALIIGGQGKGQSFGELAPLINTYVHTLLTIGEDAEKITQELMTAGMVTPVLACQTLDVAVNTASTLQVRAVVLSPACASFDQFDGFAQRGEAFVSLVHALSG